ncbi:LLM class flavin-dependent oxidoreductase [Gordonia aurantiaca]|uniref:LLM class flavin-dependent oxidoreductase n=1 Tax=Gordonia sp. B21 TaxID=3151852 RepID=UPI003265A938
MTIPLGVHLGERFTLEETKAIADVADEAGFDSLWVAEGRLTRDAISIMSLLADRTHNVRIGSGVINNKTRNPALTAVTFKTLDEIAPGRIILGVGAWWEPIASKVGAPIRKPLGTMREFISICRTMFANEEVTFQGEHFSMDRIRFDRMYAENKPVDIPIYTGPVGPKMLELSGEIADGVYLDFLMPTSYTREAVAALQRGRERSTLTNDIDITQIICCSIDDTDPEDAKDAVKAFLTMYLMQQPHIGKHCGVEPGLVDRLKEIAGWPARPEDIRKAMPLVPDDLVRRVTAYGTTAQTADMIDEYRAAGVRVPVLFPLGANPVDTVRSLAKVSA